MSELYFGKISSSSKGLFDQLVHGYYKADKNSSWFNGLQIGDYVLMVGGSKVQFWRAKKYNTDRMEFDIIINDCGIKPQELASLVYFRLDMELIVKSMRSTAKEKKAFYKIQTLPQFSNLVTLLSNKNTYQDVANSRKFVLYSDESELKNDTNTHDNDIQLYYENDEIKIVQKNFIDKQIIDSFDGKLKSKNFDNSPNKKEIRDKFDLNGSKINIIDISMIDFYDVFVSKQKSKGKNDSNKNSDSEDKTRKVPLNLILYGPPGTGKTYNTLFHALAIIKNTDVKKLQKGVEDGTLKYDDLKKEYDTYVKSGQIVFTTFHQSMSYEDFIEGIKPIPDKINIEAEHKNNTKSKSTLFGDGTTTIKNLSRMKYEVKDGVFRQICKDAGKSYEISHKIVLTDVIDYFCFDLEKTGKVIECSKSGTKYRINKIKTKKDGVYDTIGLTNDNNTSQTIKVQVIRDNYENYKNGIIKDHTDIQPSRSSKSKTYGNSELCYGLLERIKDFEDNRYSQYTSGTLNTEVTGKQNYVLIIDEINRGNVAQIFGELITLIEPSKRLGNDEAMTATLPYSQEPFGVPNNLYIIGTMNTADRSVEALDTALRRRFSFEEMMPKPELLKDDNKQDTEACGVKLSELLKTINDRIIVLKDREHQIGHSYFMDDCLKGTDEQAKEQWLANVFKDKIIPLLQEYFYGDYKKIYYVLGPGFVKEVTENKPEDIFPVKTDDDIDIDGSMTRYIIKSFEEGDDKINIKAAVNRLIKSKSDEDNLRTELKGIKFKEAIIDENGNEKERVISIDEVVERLLCGENRSKFNEEKITDLPNPNPR